MPGGHVEDFDGVPVFSLAYGPDRALALLAKRSFDVVAGSPALLILAPVLFVIAGRTSASSMVRRHSAKSGVGRHGRQFRVAKFRTCPMPKTRLMAWPT